MTSLRTPLVMVGEAPGARPRAPVVLPNGRQQHSVALVTGPTATAGDEVACVDGTGHEICAARLVLETEGEVSIIAFQPGSAVRARLEGPRSVVLSWMDAGEPFQGRLELGELDLEVRGAGALYIGERSRAVHANASLGTVAAPDPSGRRRVAIAKGTP